MKAYRYIKRCLVFTFAFFTMLLSTAFAQSVITEGTLLKVDPNSVKQLHQKGWPLHFDRRFGVERVSVINMIPNVQSDETEQDSEPNLAVDPANVNNIVGSAFTPNPTGAVNAAPIFTSIDGGNTWAMNNIVPSANSMTGDISIDFAPQDHTLYTGILRGGSYLRQMVLRAPNPFTATMMTTLTDHSTENLDQPYVSATTFDDAGANRDRVYVGFNEYDNRSTAGGTGQTASAEYSLDARTAAAPAGFTTGRIEARNTNQQDMPAIRFAAHNNGVVYGIFYRWVSGNTPNAVCDVIVVRDDNFASGTNPYTDLTDPSDNVAGRIVVSSRTVPAFPANLGKNRLVASNLSVAVHPTNTDSVYIAWADQLQTNALYRWYKPSPNRPKKTDHFYTTSTDEPTPGSGYISEGITGYLPLAEYPGTTPLYRYYKSTINDHFYTTNPNEVSSGSGYKLEGIQGNVYVKQQPGTVPLYRFYWKPARDHFYTTSKAEGDALGSDADYEGITGYIYAKNPLPSYYTLHVRHSTDGGDNWSNDLLMITNATNPALAINSKGQLGFLYQQLTGTSPNQRWETHLQRTKNGEDWSDLILANTPDNTPAPTFQPYIGDYLDLIAVGRNFYGIFSASNYPDRDNFPQGVTYQRNVDFNNHKLRNEADTADVNVSIDPFFFKVTRPGILDICAIIPRACLNTELERNQIIIDVGKIPVRAVDPIPKNCLVKWQCPGCEGTALCPPYYHIFIEDIEPSEWKVTLFTSQGDYVHQEINRYKNGLVVSFRPSKGLYKEKSIGDYALTFESTNKLVKKRYVFPTKLETSDFPFTEHMKRRQIVQQ